MSRIKLDLSKFKHVKSDKDSTTLRHKDGHILTMAHGGLSPESREQLEAIKMADGVGINSSSDRYASRPVDALSSKAIDSHPGFKDKTTPEQDKARRAKSDAEAYHAPKEEDEYEGYTDYKAKGGVVKERPSGTNEEYKRNGQNTPIGQMQRKESLREYKKAEGPKLKGLAEGGPVHQSHEKLDEGSPYSRGLPCKNPNCKSHGQPHANCKCYSSSSEYAEGGKVEQKIRHVCEIKGKHYQDCKLYAFGSRDIKPPPVEQQEKRKNPKSDQNADWNKIANDSQIDPSKRPAMYAEGADNIQSEDRDVPHEYMRDDAPESEEANNKGIDKEVEDAESYVNPKQMQNSPSQTENDQQPQDNGIAGQEPQQDAESSPQAAAPESPVKPTRDTSLAQMGTGAESTNPIQRFANEKQLLQQQYAQEDQAWAQDLANGHIKPLTYQSLFAHNEDGSEKSTLGKIGTIFGMLLSGGGSGLSHQPNAMLQMMQQTINNDLDAQKTSKANAVNYLRLSQQHEMNKAGLNHMNAETAIAANTLARMKTTRSALHSLAENLNALPPGSQKRQEAEANLALLNQYVQNDNNDLADRAATAGAYYKMLGMDNNSNGGGNGQQSEQAFQNKVNGERLLGPDGQRKAEMDIATHIPGVPGKASRPIPEDIRQRLQAQTVLDNKGQDVLNYIKKHTGTWNPQTRAVAQQKIEEMKNFYNDSIKGGVLTQGRLGWYDEQFAKHPTDILNQLMGSTAKLNEMVNSNRTRRDLELKGLGFPVNPGGSSQLKDGMTGTHNGKPTIVKNGKWEYK